VKNFAFSHTQQSTACLHFARRTTSLRVGGRAARRSCLPGLHRGGGGRQAGAAVLSCLVWRCELTAGQVRSASECVRRSHCVARHTPTQTGHRTHLSGRLSSHRRTRHDETVLSVSCPAWRFELALRLVICTAGCKGCRTPRNIAVPHTAIEKKILNKTACYLSGVDFASDL